MRTGLRNEIPDGRSTVLRAAMKPRGRSRAWTLRYVVTFGAVFVAGCVVWGVWAEWFDKAGPGWLLYAVHDAVFLPLYGHLWTALFPDALIWSIVVVGLAGLVLTEFLGLAEPLRHLQTAGIRIMAVRAAGLLLFWSDVLNAIGLRSGQVETVVEEMRDDGLLALTRDQTPDPDGKHYRHLCHLVRLRLRLSGATERDLVAVADTLGLAMLDRENRGESADRLAGQIVRLDIPDMPDWFRSVLDRQTLPDLAECLTWSLQLARQGQDDAVSMACRAVLVACSAMSDGDPAKLAFFDAWARLRAGSVDDVTAVLAAAEALCAFEFWAAQAEDAVSHRSSASILTEAFAGFDPVRIRGESWAAGGHRA